ncbi:MAG: thiamine phosphate synthase [Pseudoprimorskyibacter sp.]|nr:thiamine phosphate synthase [Pseudoprimorskyibacter sp.]
MADTEQPQIYLVTPPTINLSEFPNKLAAVLDAVDVACLRLAFAGGDEDALSRAADILRDVAHQRDVAVVIDQHLVLAQRLGLDGVHLLDTRSVRTARNDLGKDAIVGAFAGTSRHDGIAACEAGADYVSLGPVGQSSLGNGAPVDPDVFAWWSEMIEIPVVAEGALTPELVKNIASVVDFVAIGDEIWSTEDPATALATFVSATAG